MIGRLADWMGGYDDVPPKKAVDSSEQRGCSGRISGSKNISCWLEEKNCLKYHHMLERKCRACTLKVLVQENGQNSFNKFSFMA